MPINFKIFASGKEVQNKTYSIQPYNQDVNCDINIMHFMGGGGGRTCMEHITWNHITWNILHAEKGYGGGGGGGGGR